MSTSTKIEHAKHTWKSAMALRVSAMDSTAVDSSFSCLVITGFLRVTEEDTGRDWSRRRHDSCISTLEDRLGNQHEYPKHTEPFRPPSRYHSPRHSDILAHALIAHPGKTRRISRLPHLQPYNRISFTVVNRVVNWVIIPDYRWEAGLPPGSAGRNNPWAQWNDEEDPDIPTPWLRNGMGGHRRLQRIHDLPD